jgi:hypothetical protein
MHCTNLQPIYSSSHCYGTDATLSPATLAPTWVAAGWLGMSAEDYDGLAYYLFQEVATDFTRAARR